MVRLLFLPDAEVLVVPQQDEIKHDRHIKANFENWCRQIVNNTFTSKRKRQ
jgi:hypothetical protein